MMHRGYRLISILGLTILWGSTAACPPLTAAEAETHRARFIDWVDLLPAGQRNGYVPGAPPAVHEDYLEVGGSVSWGKSGSDVNELLSGQLVRISGYVVPLEIGPDGGVTEFFLAPYLGACIHVPPPPPNQMIYVRVAAGQAARSLDDLYAIVGVLRTQGKTVDIGGAAYTLEVQSIHRL